MRGFSLVRGALLVCGPALLLAPAAAAAADIEVLSPKDAATALVVPVARPGDRPAAPSLEGELHLVLRNTAAGPRHVRLVLARNEGGGVVVLPGASPIAEFVAPTGRAAQLKRLAASVANRAFALRHAGARVARRQATRLALVLETLPGPDGEQATKPRTAALAAVLYSIVRRGSAPSDAQVARLAARLGAALCPDKLRCSALQQVDVASLATTIHSRVAAGQMATQLSPVLTLLATTVQARTYPRIGAHGTRELNIRLSVPAGQAPEQLDGVLAVESWAPGKKNPAKQATLPLSAKPRPFGDIRFVPASVVIQATRWCLSCNMTRGGRVHLHGTGVAPLLERMRASGEKTVSAEVRREAKDAISASLSNFKADPSRPTEATAYLKLGSKPGPGKYAGTVELSPLVKDSPSLAVNAHSRIWVPWAILAIFLGVLASAWVTQQLGPRQRKGRLRGALEAVIAQYAARRPENYPEPNGPALIWDPGWEVSLRDNPDWNYWDDLVGASNIYTSIKWARNDADLDEAETKTRDLIIQVKMWLLALTRFRPLWDLARKSHAPADEWAATQVAKDSALLLRKARHAPADPGPLLEKLEMQRGWHADFAEAWDLREYLIEAGGSMAGQAAAVPLADLDKTATAAAKRTQDEQDELDAELETHSQHLKSLLTGKPPPPSGFELIGSPGSERELEAAALQTDLDTLHAYSADPGRAIASLDVNRALTRQPGATALTEQAPVQSDASEPPQAGTPAAQSSGQAAKLLAKFKRRDTLLSIAILLVTSLLYVGTLYNDTWGSVADFAAAFGAGFLGHLTIKWALLPIYRSLRFRAAPATTPVEGAPAGVA
jgi:hypothetical protein